MNKKIGAYFFLVVLLFSFVIADSHDIPSRGVGEEDVENIQDNINKIPIDPDTGEFDPDRFDNPLPKTKFEERIESVNTFVGPFTKFLFSVELELSFIFLFSLLMFFLIIGMVFAPVTEILHYNPILSFLISVIISIISMRSFGDNFVIIITNIFDTWVGATIAVIIAVALSWIYQKVMIYLGKRIDKGSEDAAKRQVDKDREIIHIDAEVSKKNLE